MSEPSSHVALAVGDRVVYPNQGVCRVTAIDAKSVAGQTLTFVSLKREEDGALVMVPEAKVLAIGVRRVASAEEVKKIFAFLSADTEKADLDWKQRARTNLERMSQGGLLGLAEVVKGLQILSELRPLPTKERELYDNARHLLVAEISASLSTEGANAEDAIDILLFPPGKERPKRTAEEFRPTGDDDLGDLDGDLIGLGGDLELPSDEEPPEEAAEETSEESEDEETEKPRKGKKAAAQKPAKQAAPAPVSEINEDDEVTQVMASPLTEEAPKRKRGRPPKPKPAEEPPKVPKKRGRPPKPKPVAEAPAEAPKKRGRPPKSKSAK